MNAVVTSWSRIQTAMINAVERAKSAKLATGSYDHSYSVGYAEAKRDVLVEMAIAFAELEKERP